MRALLNIFAAAFLSCLGASTALAGAVRSEEVLSAWYRLSLELVRHTPTYSPPVASRAFGYLGVTAFEAVAGGPGGLRSLLGQLNGFSGVPPRETGMAYDEAAVVQAAMAAAANDLFGNTGPTGQRVVARLEEKLQADVSAGLAADVLARSQAYGESVAAAVLNWSKTDGGAVVENMGFPPNYKLAKGPANWVPTSLVAQQQNPLLPNWGKNRPFAMPSGANCPLAAPPEYSENAGSEFYRQAMEVVEIKKNLTAEQRAIARFWSDDPMLSPTPPGHWISIALQIFERDEVALEKRTEVLALLGIAQADAFIGCWSSKFQYDLLRPVTYIRRVIDPTWESILITPPFPEYPSGHSVQSSAAADVLTRMFGENFPFEDATHKKDALKPRAFSSFRAAAEEAGISRLYGGIHYRAAIERGLDQGRCIAAFANALQTRK